MYETHSDVLLPRRKFLARVLGHFAAAAGMVVFSLLLGMAGYHHFERLGPADAFLDSAMLLGGMGPVHDPVTTGGKVFAGLYALYSGLFFIIAAGIVSAPVFHRFLHRHHLEEPDDDGGSDATRGAPAGKRRRPGSPPGGSRARRSKSST